jgi:hypothetical protein
MPHNRSARVLASLLAGVGLALLVGWDVPNTMALALAALGLSER